MKLKAKFIDWSAGIPIAMIHKETASKIGVQDKERISIRTFSGYSKEFSMVVNTIEGLIKKNEIAFSSEIMENINLKKGQYVDIALTETPRALKFIRKKLDGRKLSKPEIFEIISDIVSNELSEAETTLFVSAMYKSGLNFKETIYLIKAMLKFGSRLKLNKEFIADKHCIGGIAGNRTTPIVVSICAAGGLTMPKSSSKAITSAAGTANVIESISPVDFSVKELKKIITKTNAFLVWGGNMVSADSKIIQIEKELNIDPEAQLLASIVSKKLAFGSNYILIDIPYGKNAKVTKAKAMRLKKKFERVGKYFHKKLEVVLTKGDEPIGNGVGPVLELIDILKVLQNQGGRPKDLEEKSVFLAGKLFEMTGKAKKGKGIQKAREILTSGKAFEKFRQIIKAQGGKIKTLELGKFAHTILSKKAGKISEINNKLTNSLARVAGCPTNKSAGVYLHVHKGYKMKKRDKLLTIYSESKPRLNSAVRFYKENKIIMIK